MIAFGPLLGDSPPPAHHERYVLSPAECDSVWARYIGFLKLSGLCGPRRERDLHRILHPLRGVVIRADLESGLAEQWRFKTFHEAAAFGLEAYFRPTPAESRCDWPPGSHGKLDVLADRLSRGQDLFHPLDQAVER